MALHAAPCGSSLETCRVTVRNLEGDGVVLRAAASHSSRAQENLHAEEAEVEGGVRDGVGIGAGRGNASTYCL